MKAICTKQHDSGRWEQITTKKNFFGRDKKHTNWYDGPKYKDEITVTNEFWADGILWYNIKEWPPYGYHSKYFKPIEEQKEESKMKEVTYKEIKKQVPAISEN
jgi:hypothetical protein